MQAPLFPGISTNSLSDLNLLLFPWASGTSVVDHKDDFRDDYMTLNQPLNLEGKLNAGTPLLNRQCPEMFFPFTGGGEPWGLDVKVTFSHKLKSELKEEPVF